jgi:hypothetical protein
MATKATVCTLVPDPLLFTALAIAAQRAQAASSMRPHDRLDPRPNPAGLVSIQFTPSMAYFTLGIATGRLEYDVEDNQVTVRNADGTESMVFRLDTDDVRATGRPK